MGHPHFAKRYNSHRLSFPVGVFFFVTIFAKSSIKPKLTGDQVFVKFFLQQLFIVGTLNCINFYSSNFLPWIGYARKATRMCLSFIRE
jgi:hypothetical protein